MSLNRFSVFFFLLVLLCLFSLLIFDSHTRSVEGIAHLTSDDSDTFLISDPSDGGILAGAFRTNEIDNWFYLGHWPKSGDHIRVTDFTLWLRWEFLGESSRFLSITYARKLNTIEYVEPAKGNDNSTSPICSVCPEYDEPSSRRSFCILKVEVIYEYGEEERYRFFCEYRFAE
jgi:hypothetical protein